MSEKSKCDPSAGPFSNEGILTKQECARVCYEKKSVLFVISRPEAGDEFCNGDACTCYCFPGIHQDGNCPHITWPYADLYKITQGKPYVDIYDSFSTTALLSRAGFVQNELT